MTEPRPVSRPAAEHAPGSGLAGRPDAAVPGTAADQNPGGAGPAPAENLPPVAESPTDPTAPADPANGNDTDLAAMSAEAVRFARELIRIDSTNTGDPATQGAGETACALLVRDWLAEAGLNADLFERTTGRASLVLRIAGSNPDLPALLLHAHTDVVPVERDDWSVEPFAGEIRDGLLYGRGAVDMKDAVGMIVAVLRQLAREGFTPRRDLVVAIVADEETGGAEGMGYLVREHPELFAGVTQAIGELGGFPIDTPAGRRLAVCVGEKAIAWATLRATGTEGHGSLVPNDVSAAARLVKALDRIVTHEWPLAVDGTSAKVLGILAEHLAEPGADGVATKAGPTSDASTKDLGRNPLAKASEVGEVDDEAAPDVAVRPAHLLPPEQVPEAVARWGSLGEWVSVAFRTSSTLTQVHTGNRTNTVPGRAWATIDCRVAPDTEDDFFATFTELVGSDVSIEWDTDAGFTSTFDSGPGAALLDDMRAAVATEESGIGLLPYLTAGATDAKSLISLGIECFGFTPLTLPADFDFPRMFHGIDESVPVSAVEGGARVLREFLLRQ